MMTPFLFARFASALWSRARVLLSLPQSRCSVSKPFRVWLTMTSSWESESADIQAVHPYFDRRVSREDFFSKASAHLILIFLNGFFSSRMLLMNRSSPPRLLRVREWTVAYFHLAWHLPRWARAVRMRAQNPRPHLVRICVRVVARGDYHQIVTVKAVAAFHQGAPERTHSSATITLKDFPPQFRPGENEGLQHIQQITASLLLTPA